MSSEVTYGEDVEALGAALGEAIAELPEYEAYCEAEQAVKDSDEAQAHIEEFETKRDQFMLDRQRGEATQDDVMELKALQDELHGLPVMEEFARAQTALGDRLSVVNKAISDELDIDFAGEAGDGCGCS